MRLRLLCILGFAPKIEKCAMCGKDKEMEFFSIKENGLECKECGRQDRSAISISKSTLNAIKYSIIAPAKKLYSFNLLIISSLFI